MSEKLPVNNQYSIVEALPVGVIVYGAATGILSANDKAAQLIGMPSSKLHGKRAEDFSSLFVHGDGTPLSHTNHPFNCVFFSRQPVVNRELGIVRPEGRLPVWVLVSSAPEVSPNGEIQQAIITLIEVADQQEKGIQALTRNIHYGDIFGHMSEGFAYCRIIFKDDQAVDWIYLAVNQAFINLTGVKDVVGKRGTEIISNFREREENLFKVLTRVALTGQPEKLEILATTLGRWFNVSAYSPKKNYFVILFDDITARKYAEIDRGQSEAALKLSQLRLGLAMEAANAGFWQWDVQTNDNVWSDEIWKVYGLEPNSIKPTFATWLKTIHPDDRNRVERIVREAVRTSSDIQTEWRILSASGTERWIMSRGRPEKDEQGKVVRYNGIVIDVTQHKQAEKELFTSKAMLETALASMTDAVFISDAKGNFIHCNDAFATFHRFKSKDKCANSLAEYLAFLDVYLPNGQLATPGQRAVPRALRGETATNEEYSLYRKDSGESWVGSYSFAPIRDQAGSIVGSVVVGRDISASKEAEWQRLQQLKNRYRAIVMDQNEMICRFDRQGRITFVNDAYCRTFGVVYQDILGTNFLPHIYEEDLPLVQDHFKGLTTHEPFRSIEHRVYLPSGELHWQQWSGRVLFNEENEVVEYQAVGRDITVRKEMEKKLENELSLRQHFMDGLPGVALLIRYDTHEVITANKMALQVGVVIGRPCYTWFGKDSPCAWCLAPRLWATKEAQNCRFRFNDTFWNAHWVRIDGDHLYLHYLFDVSSEEEAKRALVQASEELEQRVRERTVELQQSHAKLMHSEKLSAVGSLSASIAHEFNNPLQSVMTVLKGLSQYATLPEREGDLVSLALQECTRMRDLISDLRDFYQPTTNTPTRLDLHRLLDGLLLLSKKDFLGRQIQLRKRFSKNLPQIIGVNDQLKQVFLNILNNASYACRDGGQISVATESIEGEVVIHIEDTGTGIKDADLPHIFEPFFTTKPELKGNGLGLSVSYDIIKSHGGHIEVTSDFGKGSIFSVFLPIEGAYYGTEIDTPGRR